MTMLSLLFDGLHTCSGLPGEAVGAAELPLACIGPSGGLSGSEACTRSSSGGVTAVSKLGDWLLALLLPEAAEPFVFSPDVLEAAVPGLDGLTR